MEFGFSHSEENRLKDLDSYHIMDSPPEASFDQFTYVASSICQTPIALLSFIDNERQWFKSTYGLEIHELPKHLSACNETIKQDNAYVIEDSHFNHCPFSSFMKSEGFRFYAGVPIISREGNQMGALCVMDYQPRKISSDQINGLEIISEQIVEIMDIRKKYIDTLAYLKKVNENSYQKDKHTQDIAHQSAMNAMAKLSSGLSYRIKPLIMSILKNYGENTETNHNLVLKNGRLILETLESLERFIDAEKEKGMSPVDIGDLILKVIGSLEWKIKKSNIEIITQIEKDIICIGNSSQLAQVVYVLIDNAIDAQTKFGDRKIIIKLKAENHLATLSVCDFGEGIIEDNRSFVFLPFFTTKNSEQLGIGLSLAQALVQRHAGELNLISNHHPTEFEVKLPVP